MPSETVDYAVFLADLGAKRTAIENAISAVRQLLIWALNGASARRPLPLRRRIKQTEQKVQFDSFFGMSGPDAVRKFKLGHYRRSIVTRRARAFVPLSLIVGERLVAAIENPAAGRLDCVASSDMNLPISLQSYSCLFRAQGQNGARQPFVVGKAVIDLGRKAQPDRAIGGE